MRAKIARKEAKETTFWLELIREADPTFKKRMGSIFLESIELRKILSAIIAKSEKKQ